MLLFVDICNFLITALLCICLSSAVEEDEDCVDEFLAEDNLPCLKVLQFIGRCRSSSNLFEPPVGYQCAGRNFGAGRGCCSPENPCDEDVGDCDGPGDGGGSDGHGGCKGDLLCGSNNCEQFGRFYHKKDDCCVKPPGFPGQRCRGRNFDLGICCTEENPCEVGEGHCETHDHCEGDLVCGENNCGKFGDFYPEDDRCCEKNSTSSIVAPGLRCRGRNFGGGQCCTPGTPCDEGEGDCEENQDCKDDLVCGENNCKKFGDFFHVKDDCCVKPTPVKETPQFLSSGQIKQLSEVVRIVVSSELMRLLPSEHFKKQLPAIVRNSSSLWGEWEPWSSCSRSCGGGRWSRSRHCSGTGCRHTTQSQTRYCNAVPCENYGGNNQRRAYNWYY